MTEKEFLTNLVSCDMGELAELFAPLTEAERKELHHHLATFAKKGFRNTMGDELESKFSKEYQWLIPHVKTESDLKWFGFDLRERIEVGQLALGGLTEVKEVGMRYSTEGAMIRVLEDRRPKWTDKWIAHLLSNEEQPIALWFPLRQLIDRGLCKKPTSEGYFRVFAHGLEDFHRTPFAKARSKKKPYLVSDYFRDSPELMPDIYGAVRSGDAVAYKFLDLWACDEAHGYESIGHAIRRLADEGALDRSRLLDEALKGLTGRLVPLTLSRLAKFHEGLSPTMEEILARQALYRDLLAVEADSVAAFALKILKKKSTRRSPWTRLCSWMRHFPCWSVTARVW